MVGPGNEMAAGAAGRGGLRASQAGREQVIDALKIAFVDGRLDKDEFDLRVSKALASYAELDALTADIPAGPAAAPAAEPARQSHNKKVIQRGTAAGAGVSMAFTAALVTVGGAGPVVGMIVVPMIGAVMAVLLAGLMTLLSWVLERGSAKQSAPGAPPGADGKASGRAAAADPATRPRQIRHDPWHTAEASAAC